MRNGNGRSTACFWVCSRDASECRSGEYFVVVVRVGLLNMVRNFDIACGAQDDNFSVRSRQPPGGGLEMWGELAGLGDVEDNDFEDFDDDFDDDFDEDFDDDFDEEPDEDFDMDDEEFDEMECDEDLDDEFGNEIDDGDD